MKKLFSKVIRIPFLICAFAFACSVSFAQKQPVSLVNLTIEGRDCPFGLDAQAPRFGWQISSDLNDVVQTSYRIIVASDQNKLSIGLADMWDSGIVNSDASQWIAYEGNPIMPSTQYYWKVFVTTNKGEESADAISCWSSGLIDDSNWKGEWIGMNHLAPGDTLDRHGVLAPRYLRYEFNAPKKIRKATLHISGLGNYVAYINGQRVGNDALTPLPTDYAKTVAYDSYDITPLIAKRNAIGAIIAGGNYTGMVQNFQTNVRTSFGLPTLKANIIIEYQDGSSETLSTDDSWKITTNGTIRNAAGYDGELWNANYNLGNWTKPGYNHKKWHNAEVMAAPAGKMRGAIAPNMHVYKTERPVSVRKIGNRHLVDFGTNGAGRIVLKTKAAKGDTITIRHAELLTPAGDNLYTENLRQAYATAKYVSDGKAATFAPEFTYYGFRYAEVEGLDNLDASDISRDLIADRMDDTNSQIIIFDKSGNDILSKILDNARRGIRSNYKGMPVDCPQRDERMPWLGDRTTGCYGESYMVNNHSLYSKWVNDICDSQRPNGSISDVSPAYWRLYNDNITWPAALPMACDMLHRQYGDLRPMQNCYQNIKKFLQRVRNTKYERGLITYDRYGDWCVPPESPDLIHSNDPNRKTDGSLIATAYYIYLCKLMERYCTLLGNDSNDAIYFANEAAVSTEAFNKKFLSNHQYANGTVTANLLPLAMGITPEEERPHVADSLTNSIACTNDCHISTGVIGIQWLMRQLSESGNGNLAYKIATQEDYPGWGYMISKGATTIWELWNGDTAEPSMNSCNHVMLLGDLLTWCYEYLGGIRPDASKPGFKNIIYKPDYSIDALAGVEVSHPSPYGLINAKWEHKGNKYFVSIKVPHNSSADIHLPSGEIKHVGSGSHNFESNAIKSPVMGWSSWNTYHVNISDSIIKSQADAMVNLGLKDAGYRYINIDDGFFGGRDASGKLLVHPVRFPYGLKPVADHIHSLGLKAGIYSDGGRNTCGNYYDNDTIAVGVGLYGHDYEDADFFFKQCGFDFIKIDFCGGVPTGNHEHLDLDEQERYTAIRNAIDATGRTDARINICRWDYPGTWVGSVGDSWRISHDIRPRWSSVKDIINQNLYLSAYAGNGHYNDMDMLEVGRGMTLEEDKTHFGLWCIMSSPLLIGCNLNSINSETLNLLKNPELIAINQDPLGLQAYVEKNDSGVYLLVKDIENKYGNTRVVAVYNSTDADRDFTLNFADVDLAGNVAARDLMEQKNLGNKNGEMNIHVPAHATRIMRLDAEKRTMRNLYEAETAYLSRYQELENNLTAISAVYKEDESCSGGIGVAYLGMRPDNDLQWRNVYAFDDGEYLCSIKAIGSTNASMIIAVNGTDVKKVDTTSNLTFPIHLRKGENTIRIYTTDNDWLPTIDYMKINKM